jgi:hypothetical protein
VVFHNLKGYDSHMIIQKAYEINSQLGNKNIDVIPNSYEKFMSFSIGDLKFIDSLTVHGILAGEACREPLRPNSTSSSISIQ